MHLFNKRTANDLKASDKILDFEKKLELIFNKGALELDFNKRKAIYDEYQEIIAKENPMLYLYAPLNIFALRNTIKNVYPTRMNGVLQNLNEIYIDEN